MSTCGDMYVEDTILAAISEINKSQKSKKKRFLDETSQWKIGKKSSEREGEGERKRVQGVLQQF